MKKKLMCIMTFSLIFFASLPLISGEIVTSKEGGLNSLNSYLSERTSPDFGKYKITAKTPDIKGIENYHSYEYINIYPAPDLVVTKIWSDPEYIVPGREVTIYFTVANNGNACMKPFWIYFYFDDFLRGKYRIPSIGGGESQTIPHTIEWGYDYLQHKVEVVVDALDEIVELNESNNNKIEYFAAERNTPPDAPHINGPSQGEVNVEYTFQIWAIDTDNDDIEYHIYWGDGNTTGWIGPYTSGEKISKTHKWHKPNTYVITVLARDVRGGISNSTKHTITITDSIPPSINITRPEKGLYIKDRVIMPLPKKTVIIGKITVDTTVSDNDGIKCVEFYIDDELKNTKTESPYSWIWDETAFGEHKISAIVYDYGGNSNYDEQIVWIINL